MGKPTTQRHADPQRGSSASRETFLGGDPTRKVTSFPSPERKAKTRTKTDLRARPYPVLIPDSDYLATCVQVFGPHSSRAYGEKIYVSFQILDGGHAGKKLPMFLRPSRFPTSRLYRSWVVANGGLPSRNATLSPRIFLGKIFRVSTVTVKPRHASGAPMPPVFWYSRVCEILSLESTGFVTEISSKSFSDSGMDTGEVGSRKLEARSGTETKESLRGGTLANLPTGSAALPTLPTPTPVHSPTIPPDEEEKYAKRIAVLREQAKQLQKVRSEKPG